MHKERGTEIALDYSDDWDTTSHVRNERDEQFYRKEVLPLYGDLYRFVRAFVGDSESAKDIAQTCMEHAWEKIHELRKKDRVKSWLFQIGRNVSCSYYRSCQTKNICTPFDPDIAINELYDAEEDVLKILLNKERSHLILDALERVPSTYREIVQLWALGDLTQKEIAEVLNINYNTARVYLIRGMKALKKEYFELEREGGADER